jgi:hypothetical protein
VHLELWPVPLDELRERRLVAGRGGGSYDVRLGLVRDQGCLSILD